MTLDEQVRRAFGDTLRECRKELGPSQEELANLTGVTRQVISKYECYGKTPTLTTIVYLAQALEMSVSDFLRPFDAKLSELEARMKVAEENARSRKIRRKTPPDDSVLYEVNDPSEVLKRQKTSTLPTPADD